jgi:hypothetical protein
MHPQVGHAYGVCVGECEGERDVDRLRGFDNRVPLLTDVLAGSGYTIEDIVFYSFGIDDMKSRAKARKQAKMNAVAPATETFFTVPRETGVSG